MATPVPELSAEIADLFDLDVRSAPLAVPPARGDSGDCTNDTCTDTCNSCGCTAGCSQGCTNGCQGG